MLNKEFEYVKDAMLRGRATKREYDAFSYIKKFSEESCQQHLTQQGSEPSEICQNIVDAVFDYMYKEMTLDVFLRRGSLDRLKEIVAGKLLPC